MRQFSLVGLALVLLAGAASAQTVVNVTTIRNGPQVITTIGPAAVAAPGTSCRLQKLDQLGLATEPGTARGVPLSYLLPDQPALLARLEVLDGTVVRTAKVIEQAKKDEELAQPKPDDPKKDDKKVEPRKDVPAPVVMQTLETKDWDGRCFTDGSDRRWCLIKGCAIPEKTPRMRGWLLESDGKKLYFLHETGNIYLRAEKALP